MGKFEQDFFAKHFKSINRLIAFRKTFNRWNHSNSGKGVWLRFDPQKVMHYEFSNITGEQAWCDDKNNPIKWIFITKQKIDKEIKRRQDNGKS